MLGRIGMGEKKLYLCLLMVLAMAYYIFFVFSVIPPQTGWWQYYAMRMAQGDLLYRDMYMYLVPYFPWATEALYYVIKDSFISYTILGLIFIRGVSWAVVYCLLLRITAPKIAFISTLFGVCITSQYLTDQVFDYNPFVFTLVILITYLFIRYSETDYRWWYLLVSGCIVGILLLIKQTVGLVMPFAGIFALWLMHREAGFKKALLIFAGGVVITSAPGILYLVYTGTFCDMLECLRSASYAKVANSNIFILFARFLVKIKYILIISLIFFLKKRVVKNSYMLNGLYCVLGCMVGLMLSKIVLPFKHMLIYINTHEMTVISGTVLLSVLASAAILYKKLNIKLAIVILVCFILGFWVTAHISDGVAGYMFYNMHWTQVLVDLLYVLFYINLWQCLKLAYGYFVKKDEALLNPLIISAFLFGTVCVSGLSAANIEAYLGLLVVPLATAYVLQWKIKDSEYGTHITNAKNYIVILACSLLIFTGLAIKMYLPYEWHGWRVSSVLWDNTVVTVRDIPGLNGFRLPATDYNSYKTLYELIKENSNEETVMYQFPNIPLFNVICGQKSIYVPVPYFDVCPDSMAARSAEDLEKNPPDLFLWADFEESRWKIHEEIFRGGEESGQREIQEFYKNQVLKEYRCLGAVDNNEGGAIELWQRKASANK